MNGWAATDHRSIGILFSAGTTCSLSDAEVLERFLSGLNDVSEIERRRLGRTQPGSGSISGWLDFGHSRL